jgi:hypothetical protein
VTDAGSEFIAPLWQIEFEKPGPTCPAPTRKHIYSSHGSVSQIHPYVSYKRTLSTTFGTLFGSPYPWRLDLPHKHSLDKIREAPHRKYDQNTDIMKLKRGVNCRFRGIDSEKIRSTPVDYRLLQCEI